MKISALIKQLEQIKRIWGDVDVKCAESESSAMLDIEEVVNKNDPMVKSTTSVYGTLINFSVLAVIYTKQVWSKAV